MKEQAKKYKNPKKANGVISPEVRAVLNEHKEEMTQLMNTLVKTVSEDFQRHTSALSEDFQGKVALVAEQVISLHDKHDTLTDTVAGLTGKVDGLTNKVDVLTDTLAMQGTKLDEVIHVQETHTEMIGMIMEDVSEIKIELKNKADKVEVARLERRIQALV